jgi:hypothetical protein
MISVLRFVVTKVILLFFFVFSLRVIPYISIDAQRLSRDRLEIPRDLRRSPEITRDPQRSPEAEILGDP